MDKLPGLKKQELSRVASTFDRLVASLRTHQSQIEEAVRFKCDSITEKVGKATCNMQTKKQVVERNYQLLQRALDYVPLQILSCEEGLLSSLLLANSGIIDTIKSQKSDNEQEFRI